MTSWDGHQWTPIAGPWPTGEQVTNAGVSCTSVSFCISVAQGPGTALDTLVSTYNGTSWTTPVELHAKIATNPLVACPNPSLCFEVDASGRHSDEEIASYSSGIWSKPSQITQANFLVTTSCVHGGECFGVDYAGEVLAFDGTTWSVPDVVDSASGVTDISCASSTFCAVIDDTGGVVIQNGGTWGSRQTPLPTGTGFQSVSCTADGACMAITDNGIAEQYKSGLWTSTSADSVGGTVACGSMSYCVTQNGTDSQWWNGSSWAAIPNSPYVTTVVCTSTDDCLLGLGATFGHQPEAVHIVNGIPEGSVVPIGATNTLQTSYGPSSIACGDPTLCVANVYMQLNTFGTGGYTPGPTTPNRLDGTLSCATDTLCVSVADGDVSVGR